MSGNKTVTFALPSFDIDRVINVAPDARPGMLEDDDLNKMTSALCRITFSSSSIFFVRLSSAAEPSTCLGVRSRNFH